MRRPEPRRQRQFRSMHRRAGGERGLPSAIEAFQQARTALQGHSAAPAAGGTNKPVPPASRRQKRIATRLVRKFSLELRQRAPAPHRSALRTGAGLKRAQLQTLHLAEPESNGISLSGVSGPPSLGYYFETAQCPTSYGTLWGYNVTASRTYKTPVFVQCGLDLPGGGACTNGSYCQNGCCYALVDRI